MIRPTIILAFAALISGRQAWEPCGLPAGCLCATPVLHEIHCQNITVFPIFDAVIKPGILSVTVYNSSIVGLPPFNKDEWDSLKYLNFVDTPRLSCEAIAEIQRPGLHILSECVCTTKKSCPECTEPAWEHTWCLATILVLIVLFNIALGFILYLVRCYKRKTWTLPLPELPQREAWV